MAAAKTLPGFKKIAFGYARSLFVNHDEVIEEGSIADVYGDFIHIPTVDPTGCTVSSEEISGETVYTTLLNLRMEDCGSHTRRLIRNLTANSCCFRLTDVYGEEYLLGLSDKPHPVVKPSFRSEETPAGVRCFSVEIQYINTHSILQIK
jgi:hypothetical protein